MKKFKKIITVFCIHLFLLSSNLKPDITFDNLTSTFQAQNSNSKIYFNNSSTTTFSSNFKNGFQIPAGKTVLLNTTLPVSGLLDLSGTLSLGSDLYLDTDLTYSGIGRIFGNGHSLHLGGNLKIPTSNSFHIGSNSIIEGHGNSINLSDNAEILVDDNVTLTLRNVIINSSKNGVGNPAIKLTSNRSKLTLDNTILNMTNDFYVDRGQVFVHNDVSFAGTNALVYRSPISSFITSGATLNFDLGTTFSIAPATFTDCAYSTIPTTTTNNFILMADQTSQLYLNGCNLYSTLTGCRLTKGSLFFDNKVNIITKTDVEISSTPLTFAAANVNAGGKITTLWAPDGRSILSASYLTNQLFIFDFNGTNSLTEISGGGISDVNTAYSFWSSDGKFIATASNSTKTIKIYSVKNGKLIFLTSTSVGANAPQSQQWSPDGKYIAAALNGGTVNIYSFDGASLTSQTSAATGGASYDVCWAPDGKFLATTTSNTPNTLRIYSFTPPSTLTQIGSLTVGSWGIKISWSPDGRYIAMASYGDNTIYIYSFNGQGNPTLTGTVSITNPYYVTWFPDGKYFAVSCNTSTNTINIYAVKGFGNPIFVGRISITEAARSIDCSPDQQFLAIGGQNASHLYVYKINYVKNTASQTLSNSLIFGNSALGSSYDLNVRGLASAQVEIDGLVNYDNVS